MSAAIALLSLALPEPPPHAARSAAEPPPAVATPAARRKRRRDSGSDAKRSNSMKPPMAWSAGRLRPCGAAGSLPPNGGVQVRDLVDREGVDPGGEVLPAVVADHEDDVALVELAGDAHRDRGDRARGDPGEQALLLEQLAGPDDRVPVGDEDLPVEQSQIDYRRDEPVVHRAKAPARVDRPVGSLGALAVDDLGAVHLQELGALGRHVLGHHDLERIALARADHAQRDAGVAGGGLEDRVARLDRALLLGILDEGPRDPVLDRPGRVVGLELGPDAHSRLGREPLELDQGRVPDRLDDVAVAAAAGLVLEGGLEGHYFTKCSGGLRGGHAASCWLPETGCGVPAATRAAAARRSRMSRPPSR